MQNEMMAGKYESQIRRLAKSNGYAVRKSRVRNSHFHDQGQYRLIDSSRNICILGSDFDASLLEIEAYFESEEEDA